MLKRILTQIYKEADRSSNLWFDNMVIPKTVKNQDAAYAFINFFMLNPEML